MSEEFGTDKWLYQICEKYRPDIVNFVEPRAVMIATLKEVGEWLGKHHRYEDPKYRGRCELCDGIEALCEGRMP
uniref:Uncharacterized protein n=1 Tax=viral metagenome TaxID=1070528 RepID=A0A6H1ZU20_9ZZZZ